MRKRLRSRFRSLALDTLQDYRRYLEGHPEEWEELRSLCRITISRFYRDHGVWEFLQEKVLPEMARSGSAAAEAEGTLRVWSAGCGSGEEPYTLSLIWHMGRYGHPPLSRRFPKVQFRVLGTDTGQYLLERARAGRYPAGCLKELPHRWREAAFCQEPLDEGVTDGSLEDIGETGPARKTEERGDAGGDYILRSRFREDVSFCLHDVRDAPPDQVFHIISCRNLVFTYFEEDLQGEILRRLLLRLQPGGYLVLGSHETLPPGTWPLTQADPGVPVLKRSSQGNP